MSYWDLHEPQPGRYDFDELDKHINLVTKYNGEISLCVGARQPRWPESHWPKWTHTLTNQARSEALLSFLETVISRYKNRTSIVSYQLENEFLNRSFGLNGNYDRERVKKELALVHKLDPNKTIIMSTSNTWGAPLRKPRPDLFGFTFYQQQFENNEYRHTKTPHWWLNIRAGLIKLITKRPSFIHELQAEPWGPKAIWEMSNEEQAKSMNVDQLEKNILLAKQTNLYPIDLWGGEWWYWRWLQNDKQIAQTVLKLITNV